MWELESFLDPEVVLGKEFPFVELGDEPVHRSAWLEPCDSLFAGEVRECLAPSTTFNCKAFDIMDTNSGLWNIEAKEATEDGKRLLAFSFSVEPFLSHNWDMISSHHELSKKEPVFPFCLFIFFLIAVILTEVNKGKALLYWRDIYKVQFNQNTPEIISRHTVPYLWKDPLCAHTRTLST